MPIIIPLLLLDTQQPSRWSLVLQKRSRIKRQCSVSCQVYAQHETVSCIFMRVGQLHVSVIIGSRKLLNQSILIILIDSLGLNCIRKLPSFFSLYVTYEQRYYDIKSQCGNFYLNVHVVVVIFVVVIVVAVRQIWHLCTFPIFDERRCIFSNKKCLSLPFSFFPFTVLFIRSARKRERKKRVYMHTSCSW